MNANEKNSVNVFNSKSSSLHSEKHTDKNMIPIGIIENWLEDGVEMLSFQYTKEWLSFKDSYPITPRLPLREKAYINEASHTDFFIFLEHEKGSLFKFLTNKLEEISAKKNNREQKKLLYVDYISNIYGELAAGDLVFKEESNVCGSVLSLIDAFVLVRHILEDRLDDHMVKTYKKVEQTNTFIFHIRGIGGSCPKISYENSEGFWIAKFPKKVKGTDLIRGEYVYRFAKLFGLNVPKVELLRDNERCVYALRLKRFDRSLSGKIPFATAKSLMGDRYEDKINLRNIYLELAEFIYTEGDPADLEELWKRMILSIFIGNRDDSLCNHGFLRKNGKWRLSPLFGMKFFIDCISSKEDGMKLSINAKENTLNLNLAIKLAKYFRVSNADAKMHIKNLADIILKEKKLLLALEAIGPKKFSAIKAYADKLPTTQAETPDTKVKDDPSRGDDGRYKKKD